MSSSTAKPSKSGKSLISKITHHHKLNPADVVEVSDSASTISKTPLIPETKEPFKSMSKEEQETFNTLMEKAKVMSSEEFQEYLRQHKEEVEEKYRKLGGGVVGLAWIWRDPTSKLSQTQGVSKAKMLIGILAVLGPL